ncbi:hypothetical protein FKR81_14755 [Lentzea tibetensis]|uniref:Uncharacterized protein n=1 Tax=Lentzea tibetensis TaxID=2591470 RepID=A0A563EUW6_9PSEU|nr:hypothetical protein [Lentzea tibetensis]TWP51470.1 hypothetical protein FKR81_14755 [Lentzea tibetensis]
MTAIPWPVLLVGLVLALAAVVLLWKLLLTAAGVGVAQWLIVQAAEDSAAVQITVFAVMALPTVLVLSRVLSTHRPAVAGGHRFAHASKETVA